MIWLPTKQTPHPLLIDVDTQNHFFRPKGLICVEHPRQVLANVRKVMKWARRLHISTFSTVQVHLSYRDYRDTSTTRQLSIEKSTGTLARKRITYESSDCMDWAPDTWDRYDQVIVHKRTFDPFAEPRADRILTELPMQKCILMGTALEGAVRATAMGLLLRDKDVFVVTDAVGRVNRAAAEDTLEHMHSKKVTFMTTDELIGSAFPVHTGGPH